MDDPRTDEALLAAVNGRPEAFGVFYRRDVRPLLGMAPLELSDAALERIEAEVSEVASAALDALPADQREAVLRRPGRGDEPARAVPLTRFSRSASRARAARRPPPRLARAARDGHR